MLFGEIFLALAGITKSRESKFFNCEKDFVAVKMCTIV